MGTVRELVDCAESNMTSAFGIKISKALLRQHRELLAAGASLDDDVDEALELYPECE